MPRSADVIVVGGGIIGLSIAREAARNGLAVRLFERGQPGCEASSAAAGMLCPQLDAEASDPLLALGLASRDLYPGFARDVRDESGTDPCLMDHGTLRVAAGPEGLSLLDRLHAFQRSAGLPAERLDAREARRMEGALGGGVEGALFLPEDRSIDNARLVSALAVAAARAGALIHAGCPVTGLRMEGGRVVGVEAGAEAHAAGAVVIAAGAWSGEIAGGGLAPVPAAPVRGQMVCVRSSAVRNAVAGDACYLVPRGDGRLLVGSTMERVGFDKSVTAEAVARLTAAAIDLVPALRDAAFLQAWAGLRPASGDELPVIGSGPAAGLWYACGHLRNGILLAPITALVIVRLLRGESPGIDLTPFDPRRFV
ncbi:MAG: glycine oxidase ThiO [Acidobacteria bacterium]|nr:MAG: glycine oxidase ThiO [Acidobacteriota bacterium]